MRVLGLCSYPAEAAATRFRMEQFVEPLRERGIELTIIPFLDSSQFATLYKNGGAAAKAFSLVRSVMKRVGEIFNSGKYNLIFVQREAMIFGPAIFEWFFQKIGRIPMVLDLDDATYVGYVSPSYGRVGSFFKFFGKTDNLIKRAAVVTCGNRFIAEYVESKGAKAIVIPTVVDTEIFRPHTVMPEGVTLTIGWIGTHSTFPFLESIFPVLARLAKECQFKLKIVGAGRDTIKLKDVEVENLEWNMEREAKDFQSLDIGLYPIVVSDSADRQWLLGKSGFKAIQYMAVGVPFVMSPVGVCAEIGEPGKTHFNAKTEEDWYESLKGLIESADTRKKMGAEARKFALDNYMVSTQADRLAALFKELIDNNRKNAE